VIEEDVPPKRVVVYIDGFNLYFGLRESGWQRYYWLDLCRLAENILPPNTVVTGVRYFSARVSSPPDKQERQSDYLDALTFSTSCVITYGKYSPEPHYCTHCFREYEMPKEKMTDVNIAVAMLTDAFQSAFDIALVVSGDSDLTPPVQEVLRLFPQKRVIIAFPPRRVSKELREAASGNFVIAKTKFRDSQLPDEITRSDGKVLRRPEKWR